MFTEPKNNVRQLNLDPGMKVADIGTGSGFYAFAASEEVGETGKVYAIDIQKNILSKIKNESNEKNPKNIEIMWGDAEKENGTMLQNESIDAVIVSNIFFQIEDKKSFLKEMYRILKQKGKMLFVDWKGSFGGIGPEEKSIISPERAREFLNSAGFSLDKAIQAGEYHYGFVFKK